MQFTKKIIGAVLLSVIGFTLFAEEMKEKAYLEVEIDGKTQGKWCDFDRLVEYDRTGKRVHVKSSTGDEWWWYEYDKNGNMIHEKCSDGYECWNEYDKNGNKIHSKDSDGTEWWNEYDKNGNNIHAKWSAGYEWWNEYDKNGNKIHSKCSDGTEWWYEYDKNGNVTQTIGNGGSISIYILEYWDDGKTLKREISYRCKK